MSCHWTTPQQERGLYQAANDGQYDIAVPNLYFEFQVADFGFPTTHDR
jgi:hypothetical protein